MTKTYTYEDMRLAYAEGEKRMMMDQGIHDSNGPIVGLDFPDYMFKHFPDETTNRFILHYLVPGREEKFTETIIAETQDEANKLAYKMLWEKNIYPTWCSVYPHSAVHDLLSTPLESSIQAFLNKGVADQPMPEVVE